MQLFTSRFQECYTQWKILSVWNNLPCSHKFIYIDQSFDYGGEHVTHLTCENLTINKVTCIFAQIVSPFTLTNTTKCIALISVYQELTHPVYVTTTLRIINATGWEHWNGSCVQSHRAIHSQWQTLTTTLTRSSPQFENSLCKLLLALRSAEKRVLQLPFYFHWNTRASILVWSTTSHPPHKSKSL